MAGAIAANAVGEICPTQAVSMRLMIGSSSIPPKDGKAMAATSLIICRVSDTAAFLVVVVVEGIEVVSSIEDEEADLIEMPRRGKSTSLISFGASDERDSLDADPFPGVSMMQPAPSTDDEEEADLILFCAFSDDDDSIDATPSGASLLPA